MVSLLEHLHEEIEIVRLALPPEIEERLKVLELKHIKAIMHWAIYEKSDAERAWKEPEEQDHTPRKEIKDYVAEALDAFNDEGKKADIINRYEANLTYASNPPEETRKPETIGPARQRANNPLQR